MLILLLLAAAGQPAIAQEKSRGAAGYSSAPFLHPPMPSVDAEEAFMAGDRKPLPVPGCDRRSVKCQRLARYVEEYNRTLEALQQKFRQ